MNNDIDDFIDPDFVHHHQATFKFENQNNINSNQYKNNSLVDWWERIFNGKNNPYPINAIFLVLESDLNTVEYLKKFSNELHLLSGDDCLIITISSLGINQYSSLEITDQCLVDEKVIEDSLIKGRCLKIADLFGIGYDQFPCLLIFNDIRQPEHILISFQDLDIYEISKEIKSIFTIVKKAVKEEKDPILILEDHYKQIDASAKKKRIWSNVRGFAGKTLETLMRAAISASIK